MTDIRNASLLLKTSDFTTNSDYIPGSAYTNGKVTSNAKLSSITWNNINLRILLGDMYDKYNTFNLCLNTISTAQANTIDSNLDSRNVNLRLYGLPFINQTYNVKNGGNTNCTSIGTFNFVPSAATTQYYYSNNIATFGKNQELCNITLEYARIYDDQVPIIAYGTDITAATGTGAQNSNQITVSISGGIVVGSKITSASGIPANTYITAINSTGLVLTISNNLTAAINSAILTISPLTSYPNILFLFDIFGIPDDGALPERLPLK